MGLLIGSSRYSANVTNISGESIRRTGQCSTELNIVGSGVSSAYKAHKMGGEGLLYTKCLV